MSLYRTPDSFWFRSLKFEGELVNFHPWQLKG